MLMNINKINVMFLCRGVRSFICWTIQIWWNLFVSDAVNRNRLTSQVLCSAIVLIPPIIISEVYSSMARLLSPTYGTYLITTWKKIETVCQLMSVNTDRSLSSVCVCVVLTYTVVRFLSWLEQYGVGLDHVVNHIALRDLFGAELLWSRQVFPIVVAKVIVADNGCWLSKAEKLIKLLFIR